MKVTSKMVWRGSIGLFLAPLDAVYGFIKGGYYFLKHAVKNKRLFSYFEHNFETYRENRHGEEAPQHSMSNLLSRVGTIVVATLCVLGFIGALAVPIPGVAPLFALTAGGIAKAMGITLGWSILTRGLGTLIGTCIDYDNTKGCLNEASKPFVNPVTPEKSSENAGSRERSQTVTLELFRDQSNIQGNTSDISQKFRNNPSSRAGKPKPELRPILPNGIAENNKQSITIMRKNMKLYTLVTTFFGSSVGVKACKPTKAKFRPQRIKI